jgi:hypothetical protein
MWWACFFAGYVGWGITLYVYNRKFKSLLDSGLGKAKKEAQEHL